MVTFLCTRPPEKQKALIFLTNVEPEIVPVGVVVAPEMNGLGPADTLL